MNCPDCKKKLKEREFSACRGMPIFICHKCSKSFNPDLQTVVMPNDDIPRKSVQRSNRIRKKLKTSIKVKVLIWGPDTSKPKKSDLTKKREEIRNSLNLLGFEAKFSEDLIKEFG